ncbi:hypothetical protein ADK33_14435 [Streptomyces griseus subsp. rhodochrous]|nr:hypothetical protein ADK33_14435 [Streptomyces griseus subsp. rhodochrous]
MRRPAAAAALGPLRLRLLDRGRLRVAAGVPRGAPRRLAALLVQALVPAEFIGSVGAAYA